MTWRRHAMALGALACAAVAQMAGARPAPDAVDEATPLPTQPEATLREINAYRAQGAACGGQSAPPAPPLRWSSGLLRAAAVQAQHMGRLGRVTHDGPDGSAVAARVQHEGYVWRTVGENAAAGRHTVSATLAQWMASPGHCINLMNPAFTEVAVAGVAAGGRYGSYWVMVLAAPRKR